MIAVLAFFAIISSSFSQVSGNVESQNLISDGKVTPQINVYVQESFVPKLAWTSFTVVSKGWSESLVGISYSPIKEISFSVSAGLETNNQPFRYSWSVWAGKYNISIFSVHEKGGSGYWFKNTAMYTFSSYLSAGVHWQRFKGAGPRIEATLFNKVRFWGTYLVGEEKKFGFVGVKLLF